MFKKILSFVLCLILILGAGANQTVGVAASQTPDVLIKLLEKFPHRSYWNHVGSSKNDPNAVTNTPCPTHSGCSWAEGACSCNSFSNAIQCMGFAYKAGYDIVGTDPRSWEKSYTLDASKLRVGDIIRYKESTHSLTVTGVKGNVISFVDANWYPMCQIRWSKMDLREMPGFSYVLHDPKNKLKNKNIDFFAETAEKLENEFLYGSDAEETWTTKRTVHLYKKASASSTAICTVPSGTKIHPVQKKQKGGYLWGKIKYGVSEGWIALDKCKFNAGKAYIPKFDSVSEIQPLKTNFTLRWSKVEGADKYKVFVYDLYGSAILSKEVKKTSAAVKISEAGKYLVNVVSYSDHVSGWTLRSDDKHITVVDPKEALIESVTLSGSKAQIGVGEERRLTYRLDPYFALDDAVFWYSENPQVVSVDGKGKVTGVSFGQANVVLKANDENQASDSCKITVCPAAPAVIQQKTSAVSDSSVTIQWSKVANVDGYNVYRKKSNGKFKLIAATSKTSYKDEGISSAKEFTYRVCAFVKIGNGKINGFYSEERNAVTCPEKVKSLFAAKSSGKVKLQWKSVPRADRYILYQYSKKNGKFIRIGMSEKTSFSVNVKSGQKTYFKIRAVKTVGGKNFASDYSAKIAVKC